MSSQGKDANTMNLTAQQYQNIECYLKTYQEYLNSTEGKDDLQARAERIRLFERLLSPDGLSQMTELEFGQVISSLWASQMWGNKSYLVDNLLDDNTIESLREQLQKLLWGKGSIANRYSAFRKKTKGVGTAMISEILAFTHPDQYGVWTDKVRKGLILLGFEETMPYLKKSQLYGAEYQRFNEALAKIKDELRSQGLEDLDILSLNYFLFEVWRNGSVMPEVSIEATKKVIQAETADDFDHDDVIDKLVAMGVWLGFEAEKEKHIAPGARVDVVWQAQIANLGVVTYVFEVQRRGSIDSLILNLQKAQNNPSVQRLVVVATPKDLDKVRNEVRVLPESFREAVSYMEVSEALRASELMSEFSVIISNLKLVQSEFDVEV
jgi:hypothetical protein